MFLFFFFNKGTKYAVVEIEVVQLLSRVWLFATSRTVAFQASLSFTISQNLLKLISIESMMPSNHLIFCRPLLLLPSTFPSFRIFSSESALPIRWPKYWSFSFSISPSNEYSRLISFRIDWFDLLKGRLLCNYSFTLVSHCTLASRKNKYSAFKNNIPSL